MASSIILITLLLTFFLQSFSLKIHVDGNSLCTLNCDGSKTSPFTSLPSAMYALDRFLQGDNTTNNTYLSLDFQEDKFTFVLESNQNYSFTTAELDSLSLNSTGPFEFLNNSIFENQYFEIEFKANECKRPKTKKIPKKSRQILPNIVCLPPAIRFETENVVIVVKAFMKFADLVIIGDNSNSTLNSAVNSLFTFGNRNDSINSTLEFSRCNISGFQNSSYSALVGVSNEVDYRNNSLEVIFKGCSISDVFFKNLISNSNVNPLYYFGIRVKSTQFLNQINNLPSFALSSNLFQVGNVLNSKVSIKNSEFSGNFAGPLVSLVGNNTKFSLKTAVFLNVRLPNDCFEPFVNIGSNSLVKVFDITFLNSSFNSNYIFKFGSNNLIYFDYISYSVDYYWFPIEENLGKIIHIGDQNNFVLSYLNLSNCSFFNPVSHFYFNANNTISISNALISGNAHLDSNSSIFALGDFNHFHINNSQIENLFFLNQVISVERSVIFSFQSNNFIEFLNNTITRIVGITHYITLLNNNVLYDNETTCQNINITVILAGEEQANDNGGYILAFTSNFISFRNLILENFRSFSSSNNLAIFGYFYENSTIVLTNVTIANFNDNDTLIISGAGENVFIFENVLLLNSLGLRQILSAHETDSIIVVNNSVTAADSNYTPSRGFYFNNIDHEFSLCELGCFNCDVVSCLLCENTLILQNGHCQCPLGSFLDVSGCLACSSRCLSCENSFECLTCEPGFALDSSNICLLSIVSKVNFTSDSVLFEWTSEARNVSNIVYTIGDECILETVEVHEVDNTSIISFNESFVQIALCGNVSDDQNFTYYDFVVNAYENETIVQSIVYHLALQKMIIVVESRAESQGNYFIWAVVLLAMVLAGVIFYHLFKYVKKNGLNLGNTRRRSSINQEMHQPLRV